MIIIDDERNHNYGVGECYNCHLQKPVRPVQVYGFIARESRGFYDLCFDCFGPQIFWKAREDSQVIGSPAPNTRLQADASPVGLAGDKDHEQGLRR